ncbi:MAG: NADH dehydrogenase (quinone) subunit D [bacterium]
MKVEESPGNFFTTQLDKFVGWCRKYSLWPLPFGTACCAIEYMALVASHYDVSRFGAEAVRFSPRQSDLLIVAGTISDKQAPVLKKIYDQMSDPKWVISMGACASSGGFYRAYHVVQGIDEIIPVDVFLPGCPPSPESLLDGVMKIQEMAQTGRRPSNPVRGLLTVRPPVFRHKPLERWRSPVLDVNPDGNGNDRTAAVKLRERFGSEILSVDDFRGDLAVTVKREKIVEICSFLRDDPDLGFNMLADMCGVDYLGRTPRFEAVYHLYSLDRRHRIRLKAPLDESDPVMDSVTPVWKGANWFEREAFDLFGIKFNGHPNLTKILTHRRFDAHALRKDHDPGRRFALDSPLELLYSPGEIEEATRGKDDPLGEGMIMNFGPSHPATHGVLRLQVILEGETIRRCRAEIGYLHRCFEKMSETHTYQQVIPFTDRLNYCSPFMNNVGWCMAVEKLLGIEIPKRAQYIRVILSEFNRIMDHMVCVGTNLVDLGALTNFWYLFRPREEIYSLMESCCGARLTYSCARIGGLAFDVPGDFRERVERLLKTIPRYIADVDKLITKNRIFIGRAKGITPVSARDAVAWGWTGPCLRACGVGYDVRKAHPYYDYDKFEFDVPTHSGGDVYSRYLVRMEEMRQSMRIIRQALDNLPGGPVMVDDKRVSLPPKRDVYTSIEALMNHFKIIMHGILPPRGEVYSYTEGANGELGFYIVSDGSRNPFRVKVRPPCFAIYQAIDSILEGHMVADIISALGSLNIIAGELER